MHASESVLVVGELLCTSVQANSERDTRNETREMCSCWGYKQSLATGNEISTQFMGVAEVSHVGKDSS